MWILLKSKEQYAYAHVRTPDTSSQNKLPRQCSWPPIYIYTHKYISPRHTIHPELVPTPHIYIQRKQSIYLPTIYKNLPRTPPGGSDFPFLFIHNHITFQGG